MIYISAFEDQAQEDAFLYTRTLFLAYLKRI